MLVNCPHCNQEVEIQIPETVRRGQLAGISLQDMTDEQLKRELVNSKSVLYKAEKRGASEDILARNKDRVDAAVAEKARRDAEKKEMAELEAELEAEIEAEIKAEEEAENIYND